MQEEINSTKTEVLDAQQRISHMEDKEPTLREIISHLLVQQSRVAERLYYLENKSRQNNTSCAIACCVKMLGFCFLQDFYGRAWMERLQ